MNDNDKKNKQIITVLIIVLIGLGGYSACKKQDKNKFHDDSYTVRIAKDTDISEESLQPAGKQNELRVLDQNIDPESAKKNIKERTKTVINLLSNKNMEAFSRFVHPTKGLRFSPVPVVHLGFSKLFSAKTIKTFFSDKKIYKWATYSATHEPVELTPSEYYQKYIYDQDFALSKYISYNTVHESIPYSDISNINENYKNAIIVEYFLGPNNTITERYDNPFLRIYYEKYNNEYYVTVITHNTTKEYVSFAKELDKEYQAFLNRKIKIDWGKKNTPDISSQTASKTIANKPEKVLEALRKYDLAGLSKFVHPDSGVRISTYCTVSQDDMILYKKDLVKNDSTAKFIWGAHDGSGFPMRLSIHDYFANFINDADFSRPHKITYNEFAGEHSSAGNYFKAYPNSICVEYYLDYVMKDKNRMSWRNLVLVFQEHNKNWVLVGIVSGQWTI